jgi:hypothetical protein
MFMTLLGFVNVFGFVNVSFVERFWIWGHFFKHDFGLARYVPGKRGRRIQSAYAHSAGPRD